MGEKSSSYWRERQIKKKIVKRKRKEGRKELLRERVER